MVKKIVRYTEAANDAIKIGYPAYCNPIDHTSDLVSNTCMVQTSKVRRYDKDTGIFETENSIYIPAQGNDEVLNETD